MLQKTVQREDVLYIIIHYILRYTDRAGYVI